MISLAVFELPMVLFAVFTWSDHSEGLKYGLLFCVPMMGLVWFLLVLPWSLVVLWLYRWRGWRRFRTAWVLAPSVIWLLFPVGSLLIDPPTPKRMFELLVVSPMPESVSNLRMFRSGGVPAPLRCLFYFEIAPEDFPTILESKPFTLATQKLGDPPPFWPSTDDKSEMVSTIRALVGDASSWPMPDGWEGIEVYRYLTEGETEYTVVADQEHRRIYFYAYNYL